MKKILWILPVILLFSIAGVLAEIATLITPASSATQSGAAGVINVSFGSPGLNYTQCLVNATSTKVNVTTSQYIANVTRFGNKDMKINASFNGTYKTTELQDSNDYIFGPIQCTLENDTVTTIYINATNTGITINNTVPTAATLIPTTNYFADNNSITLRGTVTDASTTSCTLKIYTGSSTATNSYIMTYSTTSCTYTPTLPDNFYYWTITSSDGTDTRESAKNTIEVSSIQHSSLPPNEQGQPAVPGQTTNKSNIMLYIIIGVLVYFGLINKKTKIIGR
jgi:hypothetical protein